MRNYVKFLFLILWLSGCRTEGVDPVGTYENVSSNKVQQGYEFVFQRSICTLNNKVVLKEDSTFEYSNCGGVNNGTWKMKENSILLMVNTFKSSVDSVPIWDYEKGQKVMSFEMDGDELLYRELVKISNLKKYDMLNWVNNFIVKVKKVKN